MERVNEGRNRRAVFLCLLLSQQTDWSYTQDSREHCRACLCFPKRSVNLTWELDERVRLWLLRSVKTFHSAFPRKTQSSTLPEAQYNFLNQLLKEVIPGWNEFRLPARRNGTNRTKFSFPPSSAPLRHRRPLRYWRSITPELSFSYPSSPRHLLSLTFLVLISSS